MSLLDKLLVGAMCTGGFCMLLKVLFLRHHMWQRGTRNKTAMRFLVFELFTMLGVWVFYEHDRMPRWVVTYQRVITVGIYLFPLALLVRWATA